MTTSPIRVPPGDRLISCGRRAIVYVAPIIVTWLRPDLETAMEFHFCADLVRFGAAYLALRVLWLKLSRPCLTVLARASLEKGNQHDATVYQVRTGTEDPSVSATSRVSMSWAGGS